MKLHQLNALSPIDGRYFRSTNELTNYFSESALIKYRVKIEIEYFIALCKLPLPQLKTINSDKLESVRKIYSTFQDADAQTIKNIEQTTQHDVKAVEYFVKKKFEALNLSPFKEFVHFGLTSQDINNTAIPLTIMEAWNNLIQRLFNKVTKKIKKKAIEWKEIPMLARTHGQPASPTTLGKELYIFVDRIERQMLLIKTIPFSAKFGGSVGNFNAHHVAFPNIDWVKFAENFVNNTLGLYRSKVTSQIDHYDCLAAFFDNIKRLNTILLDFCKDIWCYISMEYFKQKISDGEIGSSAMPHKINPINFENAEGNLGIANVLFRHLADKLPISRLQRDLTDSTVIRNVGVPIAHTIIALKSILRGLDKLILNSATISSDLQNNWAIVAEGIQTILRREGYCEPYEKMLSLTRTNQKISKSTIFTFIKTLDIPDNIKTELLTITPDNYTGIYNF